MDEVFGVGGKNGRGKNGVEGVEGGVYFAVVSEVGGSPCIYSGLTGWVWDFMQNDYCVGFVSTPFS